MLQKIYLALHRRTFAARLRRQRRFPELYVVAVGNLSTGGTGKTPAVLHLAKQAILPMVILRGYRGGMSRKGGLVSSGSGPLVGPRECGDEAALYARTFGLRVAVGRDRVAAIESHSGNARTIFLDDAFQNPSVYRDHELVLIDAAARRTSLRLLPAGRLREPWEALARADTVLLTRVSEAAPADVDWLMERIGSFVPGPAIFRSEHRALPVAPALPKGAHVGAFCGIGNPQSFFHSLRDLGVSLMAQEVFPDHHHYSGREVARLIDLARAHALVWVTTEKDAVRLMERADVSPEFLSTLRVLPVEIRITGGREEEFVSRVLGPALRPR